MRMDLDWPTAWPTRGEQDELLEQLEAILSLERLRRQRAEQVLRQIADNETASARYLRSLAAEHLELS